MQKENHRNRDFSPSINHRLLEAIRDSDHQAVSLCIQQGAHVNTLLDDVGTILEHAVYLARHHRDSSNRWGIVQLLIEAGANPLNDRYGFSTLYYLSQSAKWDLIEQSFKTIKQHPTFVSQLLLLHRSYELFSYLINKGNLEFLYVQHSNLPKNAIMMDLLKFRPDLFKDAIEKGFNLDHLDYLHDPLFIITSLLIASKAVQGSLIRLLIKKKFGLGMQIEPTKKMLCTLFIYNKIDLLKLAIPTYAAELIEKDQKGYTLVDRFSICHKWDLLEQALSHQTIDVNKKRGVHGNTLVHEGIMANNKPLIKHLLCLGGRLDIKNHRAKVPLDFTTQETKLFIQTVCEQLQNTQTFFNFPDTKTAGTWLLMSQSQKFFVTCASMNVNKPAPQLRQVGSRHKEKDAALPKRASRLQTLPQEVLDVIVDYVSPLPLGQAQRLFTHTFLNEVQSPHHPRNLVNRP